MSIVEEFWKRIQDTLFTSFEWEFSKGVVSNMYHSHVLWLLRKLYNVSEITSEIVEKYQTLYSEIETLIQYEHEEYRQVATTA